MCYRFNFFGQHFFITWMCFDLRIPTHLVVTPKVQTTERGCLSISQVYIIWSVHLKANPFLVPWYSIPIPGLSWRTHMPWEKMSIKMEGNKDGTYTQHKYWRRKCKEVPPPPHTHLLTIWVILISHNNGTTTMVLSWTCKFMCMSLCNGCVFNRDWRDWAEIFCCHQLHVKLMMFCRMQWWRCPHQTSKGIHLGEVRCHRTVSRMVRIQYRVEERLQEVNHRTYCTVSVWPFRRRLSLDQTCSSLLCGLSDVAYRWIRLAVPCCVAFQMSPIAGSDLQFLAVWPFRCRLSLDQTCSSLLWLCGLSDVTYRWIRLAVPCSFIQLCWDLSFQCGNSASGLQEILVWGHKLGRVMLKGERGGERTWDAFLVASTTLASRDRLGDLILQKVKMEDTEWRIFPQIPPNLCDVTALVTGHCKVKEDKDVGVAPLDLQKCMCDVTALVTWCYKVRRAERKLRTAPLDI